MARRALAALAIGALLALSACSEEGIDLPVDSPTLSDWESSLDELASEFPTDLASELWEIVPDMSPQDLLDNAREVCQKAVDKQDEEQLARDAAELFGVEEAEGPTIVETIRPHCDAIG
ncbi:hypothetical protein K3N28_01880 [Glycomyces sp. TRM65418]|uniref:hypothetical protein n=1 Tax=Glycomyces sp. TRM65418 TaxID=2867006 RepID=UPI001CE60363|nr:hypothetical protein [Glycomyces sp. TRM65418]MCC3761822.1 hypothetical protein [Glycomyces sp. TRM65418]QZD55905.1 hypothetical protein K3N28_01870 [Glycomyces sp. TRM65418]